LACIKSGSSPERLLLIDALITFCLLCKHVENLLKSRLDNTVLTDVILILNVFHQSKQKSDRVSVSADLQFPSVTIVLDDIKLFE